MHFPLRFEDLAADPEGVAREVLSFLGIAAEGLRITALTVKTSDPLQDEWIARYRHPS
jgi:LPS sulfotransferase NodH